MNGYLELHQYYVAVMNAGVCIASNVALYLEIAKSEREDEAICKLNEKLG